MQQTFHENFPTRFKKIKRKNMLGQFDSIVARKRFYHAEEGNKQVNQYKNQTYDIG